VSEVWYTTDDPTALRSALDTDRFRPTLLMDIDSTRLLQQEDPLVAAGWQGILAIAFGAVLLLSAIGFLVYSYLTAQQRALEFAILRTLGFSRWQVFSLVTFEHLFVIVTGMGLGTAVGIQVGRMMMGFLGTDERGQEVFPPFVLGISWPSVFVAWGVLGSVFIVTIGAVVLLYWRLAVHRALRIGDA
jgi:ABC-type antimicrobial peptide transport system permease subunit